MGILWEQSFATFLVVTCVIAGGIAYMTGRGIALTWRPLSQVVGYVVLLAGVTRFFHYALHEGTLLSVQFYLIDLIVLMAAGMAGFYMTRTRQMARQYSWKYTRTGLFSLRRKA